MAEDNIFLIYNNEKRNIKIPNNYSELQNIFLKEFNEDINKIFSFSYLLYIDKESDFSYIMNQIKEKSNSLIYVSLEKEKKENPYNKMKIDYLLDKNEEKEIILHTSKTKEYKNIKLNEEAKNKLKDLKSDKTFNEIKEYNFSKKNEIKLYV